MFGLEVTFPDWRFQDLAGDYALTFLLGTSALTCAANTAVYA